MGTDMRLAGAILATLMLIATPVAAVEVYRTPYIPVPLPEPRAGTVVISTSVFDGTVWATDQTIVLADPTIDVDCGEQPPRRGA